MKALYLEPDEEITSVVDRLREIDDKEVAIVIPRRAGLVQSIINLKLLRYQGEQLGKKLSIVTTDKTGRNLASAVGLTVYQKLPEGGKVDEAAVKEPPGTPIPVSFRKSPGKPPEPTGTGPTIKDIGFKAGSGPDLKKTALPDQPAPEPPPEKAAKAVPKKNVPVVPEPPKAKGVSKPVLALPKLSLPKLGKASSKVVLIALAVLLLGAGTAAAVILPKAEVTVAAKTDPLNADLSTTFSAKAQTVDPTGNVVPAKVIEVTKSSSKEVTATGTKDAGEKAQGEITIVNTLSKNQPLVARTRFQSPDGKIFRIQSGVTVPAGDKVTATVVADEGGESGNLAAGTKLTIPGLGGTDAVYGQADTALSGGTSTPTKQVSREDVTRAKDELGKQAAEAGLAEAKAKLAVGYTLNEQVAAVNVISSKVNPAVGTTADKFTITGQVKISYFTYQDGDLQKLLKDDLKPKVPAGSGLVNENLRETFVPAQTSDDKLVGTMQVQTATAKELSKDQIKKDIAGKKPGEAEQALKGSGQASNVRIRLSPFWVTSVPKNEKKIDIRYSAAAAPSPSASPRSSQSPAILP